MALTKVVGKKWKKDNNVNFGLVDPEVVNKCSGTNVKTNYQRSCCLVRRFDRSGVTAVNNCAVRQTPFKY